VLLPFYIIVICQGLLISILDDSRVFTLQHVCTVHEYTPSLPNKQIKVCKAYQKTLFYTDQQQLQNNLARLYTKKHHIIYNV